MKNIDPQIKDPQIKVSTAIDQFDGNQAKLARALGISKTNVTDWKNGRDFVPPLHAYRLREMFPSIEIENR